jgi:hypothetical protein
VCLPAVTGEPTLRGPRAFPLSLSLKVKFCVVKIINTGFDSFSKTLSFARKMSGVPLTFRGIAHPPAKKSRDHPADLSTGELMVTQAAGLPIHVEHDTSLPAVGNVLTSYEGNRGELRVMGQINDPETARQVREGSMRGLSLGTDCVRTMDGRVLTRSQRELSVCEEGRRNGTWITEIDNKLVHTVAAFSAKGARGPPAPHTLLVAYLFHLPPLAHLITKISTDKY